LFAPTELSKRNLISERVYGKIFVTGNTVVDAVYMYLPLALSTSKIMNRVPFREYCMVTLHRQENVDSKDSLRNIVGILKSLNFPAVFPLHPRTEMRLREYGLFEELASQANITLLQPIGYFDSLVLMKNCRFILTDSGGLQEEATVPLIRKPTLVARLSTERPEAVEAGFGKLVGLKKKEILQEIENLLNRTQLLPDRSPYGNGKAARKIVDIVTDELESDLK